MAGKSDFFENALLKLIFNGTAIANIADNAASAPLTVLYLSLHTSDPGDSGNQSSNETTYTGYNRISIARTNAGWAVAGNQVSPAAAIEFGQCTVGGATITHAGIGVAGSGAGTLLYSGAVTPNIVVAPGVVPKLTPASVINED